MGKRKPTLGYPSRTMAVIGLREQGLSGAEIAEKIGIHRGTVGAIESSYRASVKAKQGRRSVVISREQTRMLHLHAERRGVGIEALLQRIVDTVIAACPVWFLLSSVEAIEWADCSGTA